MRISWGSTLLGGMLVAVGSLGCFLDALTDDLAAPLMILPCLAIFVTGWAILGTMVFRRWLGLGGRIAVIVAIVPTVVFAALGLPKPNLMFAFQYPGIRLHFMRELPTYSDYVARLPKNGERFAEFNWGGMLFASAGITYDETDEVALPAGRQSPDWERRMKNTDLTCGGNGPIGTVEPMGEHYYYTSFGC